MESVTQAAGVTQVSWRVQLLTVVGLASAGLRWSDRAHMWLPEATSRGCPGQGLSRGRGTPKLSNCVTTCQAPVWLCV